ncbi:MAG: PKD domain-containing protein [Methanothrix sp.]|nr:PKD domain-containing protein [Methanothrix sp.]
MSCVICGSVFDAGQSLQWAGGYAAIVPYWPGPFICVNIYNNPPEIPVISGSANGVPAASYSYSTFAVDPDGVQVKITIDWGDETESTTLLIKSGVTASANHTWSKAGTYRIRATATDSKGAVSGWSESLNITINTPPSKPKAPFGPILGIPGAANNYTVSSNDPDEDQIRYTFDWGDGTKSITGFLVSGARATVNHTWNKAGIYRIKAFAVDERGDTSGWSEAQNVIINSPPDTPSKPSGPESVYAWAAYAYTSFASDPDGDETEYTFDWGDGNESRTNIVRSGCNASAVYSWCEEGTYLVRVIARDRLGATSNWSGNLTVTVIANNKPNKPGNLFGPGFGYIGIAHSYFTMAKDIDGDKVMYSFDWGDKATSTTGMVDSGSVESANHTWIKAGSYRIKANATDCKGASSGWTDLMNVTISDNDPPDSPIVPAGPTHGRRKAAYRYATSANDPDGDPVKYVFDWGDKTTSWTGLVFTDSGKSESVSHKWSQAGTYQVKAMALDDKGATSGWSNSLMINISSD